MSNERVELDKVPLPEELPLVRGGYPSMGGYPDAYIEGYGYGDDYGNGGNEGTGDITKILRHAWHIAWKRKWLIVSLTAIATIIVTLEVMRIRSTYTASTMVEIRKDTPFLIANGTEADLDNSVSINTKILMFSSRPLLEDVITSLKLDQNDKFLDISQKHSRWETLKSLLTDKAIDKQTMPSSPTINQIIEDDEQATLQNRETIVRPQEDPRLDRFVSVLEGGMKVEHIKDTQALKISYTHTDRYIAAGVANGLARSFINLNFQNKTAKFAHTSNWLDRSTRELKAKVQQAEQALANYSRDHDIFSTQGPTSLTSDKLTRLHDQVMRADVELLLKESLYEEVKQGRVSQLPDAFADPKIADFQKKQNELSVLAAQLSVSYGPENPRVIEVQQQVTKIQEQITASQTALEQRIKSDYERALRDDKSLKAALEQAKSEAVQQDQSAIQYNILKQDVDTARALYNEFLQKTSQANLEVAQQQNNVSMIRPARVPRSPDGLNRLFIILIGFFFGLAGGFGLAFALDYFDNTIKTAEDVNRYTQLPILGIIPSLLLTQTRLALSRKEKRRGHLSINGNEESNGSRRGSGKSFLRFLPPASSSRKASGKSVPESSEFVKDHMVLADANSPIGEAYRALRTSVLLSNKGNPPKTILITSCNPGEGKTTTVINTAISLAQLGASVLIIDADLRKPAAHNGFGLNGSYGLTNYLSSKAEVNELPPKLQIPNLSLLPCGPIMHNPAELIGSERMKKLLRMLADNYDYILIDSPPLMCVTDPVILSTIVDGVILVVHGGKSRRDSVRQARQMLSNVGANIYGVVLNQVDPRDQLYGGLYYYSYYSEAQGNREDDRVSDLFD